MIDPKLGMETCFISAGQIHVGQIVSFETKAGKKKGIDKAEYHDFENPSILCSIEVETKQGSGKAPKKTVEIMHHDDLYGSYQDLVLHIFKVENVEGSRSMAKKFSHYLLNEKV